MTNLFEENFRILEEEIKSYLNRKIYSDQSKCCLDAYLKNEGKCAFYDSEDHIYSRRVSNSVDEVVEVSELLCMSPVFLNSYLVTDLWSKYFSQSGYMKYHIESWYINVIRLEDMFLILINEILRLGIKKELIGYQIVVTNERVPDSIKKNLISLHKAIKPIRTARIMLIHHQTLFEKKLYEIRSNENLVKLLRKDPDNKKISKDLSVIESVNKRFFATRYRKNKRDYMLSSNKSLLQYVSQMLLMLEKNYLDESHMLVSKRLQ